MAGILELLLFIKLTRTRRLTSTARRIQIFCGYLIA